jgi:hypothetical protein
VRLQRDDRDRGLTVNCCCASSYRWAAQIARLEGPCAATPTNQSAALLECADFFTKPLVDSDPGFAQLVNRLTKL